MKKISVLLFFMSYFLFGQKTVFTPTEWSNTGHEYYNRMSPDRMFQSENFVLYWGDLVGTNPQTASDANLRFNPQAVADTFEYIFNRFITDLKFINNAPTTNFGKYKTPVIILGTFSGGDDRTTGFAHASSYSNTIGAMFVHPAAVKDGGAISHEYAHALQMMMRIQENPGNGRAFAGYDWAGPFFEGHANFMRAQRYQKWANIDGTLTRWIQTRHFMWSSNRHHYTNYNVLFYVQEKDGFDFTRRMWAESANEEHPFETIKRLKGFTQEQLNDYLWGYAAKDVTFDYPILWNSQINTSSNFGQVIRATYQTIKNQMPRYTSRQYTLLNKVAGSSDRYYVNDDWAPQDYGMNIIPLYPTCTETEKSVTVKFKGHTEVNTTQAGWRYGFVTTKSDGTVSRYSPMYSSADGEASFTLNSATESNIYLVVFSAPKTHVNYNMDVGYPKQRRYPYELKIANAVPEGYQSASSFRSWLKVNGHIHSNGGGWVSNNASVASTVYVGPYAIVRGGTLSGTARIEDWATVEGGTISGSAIVRGNAYVYNATIADNAVVEGNGWMEGGAVRNTAVLKGNALCWGASYTGTVVVGGDAEVPSCASGVYLQAPYWRNGRTECDGKGATDASNVDINPAFTIFTDGQMAFAATPGCGGTTPNTAPTVSISSPANNATFTAPASITINATAADADGTISSVAFYNGTTLLGTDATSPYSYSWTGVAAGAYSITARATDNAGAVTTSTAISVVVSTACTPTAITPYVQLNGGSWSQTSTASLNAGGSVKFGPQPVSGGSWSWTGPNSYAATSREITLSNIQTNQAGNYLATYTNASGCTSTQTFTVTVITPNTAPTVSITAPANNASFTAPASISISAAAADADGTVSSVAFYNGTTLLGSDATSPYSFSWTNVTAGTYSLTAIATDNAGAVTTSSAITVVVNAAPNTAPTVSITAPANNASFTAPANIAISATAADADGTVSSVAFYNGTTLLGSDATSPYSFSWTNVAVGSYSLTAIATDNAGAVTTSSAITVVVNAAPNTAPTVSITAPANNASFTAPASITISATAAEADGTVSSVAFYNGSTLLGSDATSPYSFSWTNVAVGSYSLTAIATDNAGAVTTSTAITVVLNAAPNTAPTVSITAPANNASFTAPESITISATAADADGTVSSVAFYNGTTLLGTDATSPYSFSWTNVAAGTYSLTARATDNAGAITTSGIVTVVVNSVSTADIIGPDCGANNTTLTFELNSTRRVNATSYNWWYTASSNGITMVAGENYKANLATGAQLQSGQVCVGVNYTAAPWYTSYCKTLSVCGVRTTVDQEESAASMNIQVVPNPSEGNFRIVNGTEVKTIFVLNALGALVYQGIEMEFILPEEAPNGMYYVRMELHDGSYCVEKIQKVK